MKKILSAALAAMLLLSGVNVYAYQPSLDFLNKTYTDYKNMSSTGEIGFKLGSDIKILDKIAELTESTAVGKYIDVKGLTEGLFDSTIKTETKSVLSADKIKCEAKISSSSPIKINRNLELNVNSSYHVWADIAKDGDAVSSNYIISMPLAAKYITMNDDDMKLSGGAGVKDAAMLIFDSNTQKSINEKNIQSINKNARVAGNSGNVTVTFTDAGLKSYISDMKDIVWDLYDEETKAALAEIDFSAIETICRKVKIFDDNALVINYSINSDGNVTGYDFTLNVNTNAYDIMQALGTEMPGITADNSKIAFTVKGKSDIKYGSAAIAMPEINDDNSMSIVEYAGLPSEDTETDEEPFYYICVNDEGDFVRQNNEILVPVRNLLEAAYYDVSYADGIIDASREGESFAAYDKIKIMLTGGANADGKNFDIVPVVLDDKAYVTVDGAEKLLNAAMSDYGYSVGENYSWIGFGQVAQLN